MTKSPYLKPNRLADVIAAIQFMALNERSSQPCDKWAHYISGDVAKADHWRAVFNEHPEFFRKSPDNEDHYALVWRRASPRLFYRKEDRLLTKPEFDQLPAAEQSFVSRVRVPEAEIKTLVDIAIELHSKAREQQIDWRWWVPIAASFVGALIAVLLGIAFGAGDGTKNDQDPTTSRLVSARN